ncbi:MAG: AAA family ATPase [Enhygromyxa sp.]
MTRTYTLADPLILAQARLELEPRRALAIDGVLRPLAVEPIDGGLVVRSEAATGVDLESLVGSGPLSAEQFLPLALSVTAKLAALHERGLVHEDLRPATLHLDADRNGVVVGAPAIPALIVHERRARIEAGELLAICPYLAPELGSRSRFSIDVRSDLYALGASLYRLLAGRPPFVADSIYGFRQVQLTRVPRPLAELAPTLAAIVAKLLAPSPGERYQSAAALLRDLERAGEGESEFELGEDDRATSLLFSFRPQAREPERGLLLRELASVDAGPRVVVVHGPSGVGKTALIESFEELVVGRGGLFGAARCEPEGPPHAALLNALEEVAAQLENHSMVERAGWSEHLRERVGELAAVIVERSPCWAPWLGERDPAPALEPEAGRRRDELALARLLRALGERAPLVLALDDLEAAGADDRALLGAVLAAKPPVLLLLGVGDPSAASWLEGDGTPALPLPVEPLRRRELAEWLAQLFGVRASERASLELLAALLERRTSRIVGRVRCGLARLFEAGLLEPSPSGWTWDSAAIESSSVALDGAGWIADVGERLAAGDLELLGLAAIIGERFADRVLARASGREPEQLVAALARLSDLGLLAADDGEHRFAWGVRAAALAQLGSDRRRAGQLAIATALDHEPCPANAKLHGTSEAIAALVVQAGGAGALERLEPAVREGLARRCAVAGRTALANGAWEAAPRYLAVALAAAEPGLEQVSLARDHALALAVAGQIERADAAFDALLERQLPLTTRAELVVARIRSLTWQARKREALELGLAALAGLGVHVRRSVKTLRLGLEIGRAYLACRGLELDTLLDGETSPELAAKLSIAEALADAAYFEDPRLFVLIAAIRARWIAGAGRHPSAPLAIAHVAVAIATVLRQADAAARLCDLAIELCDHVEGGAAVRARVESAATLVVWPMVRPLGSHLDDLVACWRHAIELGDVGAASMVSTVGLGLCFHAGLSLAELQALGRHWRAQLERWSSADVRATIDAWIEFVEVLVDPQRESTSLLAEPELIDAGVGAPIRFALGLNGALALWLLGEREAAAARMEPLIDEFGGQLFGSWQIPPGAVMLAIVANYRVGDDELERRTAAERIRLALAFARRFARTSTANFGAHVELITGELERVHGRVDRAVLAYERARELANDTGNACMQALACDRLANLALATGRRVTARGAAVTAVAALRRWGAEAAARQLELAYAELLAVVVPSTRALAPKSWLDKGLGRPRTALEPSTVLGVMHGISDELRLEEVVVRVLGSAVASSGDERGVLLLEHEGVLGLVAEGDGVSVDEFVDEPVVLASAARRVPRTIIEHTHETGAVVVIDDASTDLRFAGDPYLQGVELGSLLCMPIARNSEGIGVLLLEHRRASGGFLPERIEILRILLTQAASAISHARLFEALHQSEVLFRSLVDGVPDMISLLDREGRVEFINHVAGFGTDPAALIGIDSTLLMDPICGPQWRAAIEEVGSSGEPRALEIRGNFPGGVTRWFSIRLNALEFGGKIRKLITIATDITDRKLAEAAKLRLEAQLRQQQRLESVGTLASGVAHEINNPVQGIMNYADLILARASDTELVVDFAAEILTESERIATIVRNLLEFSRQEADHTPEVFGVGRLIDMTLSLIRAVVRKDEIELRIDLPEQLHDVRCRPQQIQQILMNLVANARDALNQRHQETGARKTIDIRARNFDREGHPWVRISIEDCGAGIPEQVRGRIFDPFFTTKGRDQGTGLGLAVSHGIAVEHGGELWFETEIGAGTVFHLDLPAAPVEGCGDDVSSRG